MATCVAPGGHPMHHGFVQHLIVPDDQRPHPAIENPGDVQFACYHVSLPEGFQKVEFNLVEATRVWKPGLSWS